MLNLLPKNATPFEIAFQKAMISHEIPRLLQNAWQPDLVSPEFLPWLAWQLSVDEWRADWPLAVKIEQIKNAPQVHRRKGTIGSIKRLFAGFNATVSIREWFQKTPKGVPHTFDIVVSYNNIGDIVPDQEFILSTIKAIDYTKPLRSHYTFTQSAAANNNFNIVAVLRPLKHVLIDCIAA